MLDVICDLNNKNLKSSPTYSTQPNLKINKEPNNQSPSQKVQQSRVTSRCSHESGMRQTQRRQ